MATYQIASPDGARYQVTAPDAMSQADVLARFQREVGQTQQPESWGSYLGGLARQAVQGATFGFGDEVEARLRAILGEDYDKTVTDIRRQNRQFASEHPIASTVAGIGGGVLPFLGGPGAGLARLAIGSTLPRTIARSAAVGAGAGAVSGAGAGEGSLAERLPSAAEGALVGAGIGAVVPPVFAGAGRALNLGGQAVSAADRLLRGARTSRPSPDYEAPVQPVGRPIEGATFTADGGGVGPPPPEAYGAQEGGLQLLHDWLLSSGGSVEGLQNAFERAQRSTVLHSSGRALNAQTLAELYPPFQRLLRSLSSGYREVGEDVMRFLQARQTGILPPGASAQELAQRGIPTRERFMAGRTVGQNEAQFGVRVGSNLEEIAPPGQLARLIDATKRLFRIADPEFHGHAATASRTSDEILAAMEAASKPAYDQANAVGDMVSVRPAIESVADRWTQEASTYGKDYRQMVKTALDRFRDDNGDMVSRLRAFDKAKQKLDSDIGTHVRAGQNFEVRELTRLKNDMLAAVDGIQQGNLGQLYSQARGIYAKGAQDNDILEGFKTAWKDDPEAVLQRYDALKSPEEQKLARLGIVWGMEHANAFKRASQDATLGLDINNAERMLTLIGQRTRAGQPNAARVMRRFGDYVSGEQEMVRGTARTAVGGSMTDRNLQDALAMGSMEIMQHIQTLKDVFSGSTSMWHAGQRLFEWAVNRAFGPSADRAIQTARMLLTANPREQVNIIARLRMIAPANRMARFNDLMQRLQTAVGPSTGIGAAAAGAAAGAPTPTTTGTTFL